MRINRLLQPVCLGLLLLMLASCAAPGTQGASQGAKTPDAATDAGSKPAAAPRTAMGRYVERSISEVSLPELQGGEYILCQSGGKAYSLGEKGMEFAVSDDLINWTIQSTGYAGPDADYRITNFAVAADGAIYFLTDRYLYESKTRTTMIQRVKDGSTAIVEVEKIDGKVPILGHIELLDSGNLLARSRDDGILQIAPDGSIVQKYQVAESYVDYNAHGDELAVFDGANILFVSLSSGSVLRTLPVETPGQRMSGCLRYDDQGTLYFANDSGIYRINAGGTLQERIVDGALCTLSDPTAYADQLMFDAQKRPTMSYLRYPKMHFIAYEYDETVPTEPNIALNLFSMSDNRVLQKAVLMYQSAHPDVMVRWTVAIPRDSTITVDDAIRTLNTEVLAGKGPDLFVLDELPIEAYIRKGVLTDLTGVLQPLLDQDVVFPAVTDAFLREGRRCALPTRFALPTLWGDVEGIRSLADLEARAKASSDLPPFGDMSPTGLIEAFLPASLPAWKAGDGLLDPARVSEFLTHMRGILGDWTPDDAYAGVAEELKGDTGITLLTHDKVSLAAFVLNGSQAVSNGAGALYESKKGGFMALPGQSSGVFIPRTIFGVNAASPQPELCTAFVEMLLDESVQGLDIHRDDFPVRKASFDALLAQQQKLNGIIGVSGASSEYTSVSVAPDAQMVAKVRGMADDATICSLPDPTLLGILVEESKPFFAGTITADQAAQSFASRANAYLSE